MAVTQIRPNMDHWQERVDLAAAFRWTVRLNMHEAVANHFSLAINDDGTKFLMNPNQMHFSRIKASDLIVVDANDPDSMEGPDAPDPTRLGPAWRDASVLCPRALCDACTFALRHRACSAGRQHVAAGRSEWVHVL